MPKEQSCFIQKLYAAIEEQRSPIVDWDPSGKGFIVGNLTQFTNQVLLRKFGIGRLDSFARKLNKHGFKRSKIDKNKIRFFHKYFSRQSKNLSKIKKLTKQESLPKHIKLKLIREELCKKTSTLSDRSSIDIVNEILEAAKNKEIDRNSEGQNQGLQSKQVLQQNFKQLNEQEESDNDDIIHLKDNEILWRTCQNIEEKTPQKTKQNHHNKEKLRQLHYFLRDYYQCPNQQY